MPERRSWRRAQRAVAVLRALAAGAAAGALSPPTAVLAVQQGRPSVTVFVNVSVVPMDRERIIPGQTVVVRGDRIVAIGPAGQVKVPAGATRVDGTGRFLMPGLADMHAHPWDFYQNSAVDSARFFLYLAHGVTTVRDMHSGGVDSKLLAAKRAVAAGTLLGPRIYTAGDPDLKQGESRQYYGDTASLRRAAASVAALKAAGHDFVKLYAFPRPAYDSVIAAAARAGLRVVGHVPTDVGVAGALRDRWASIEHLTEYFEAITGLTWGDTTGWFAPGLELDSVRLHAFAADVRRAGVWSCPTLTMHVPLDGGVRLRRFVQRALEGREASQSLPWAFNSPGSVLPLRLMARAHDFDAQIVKALHDAGAGLILGTDSDPSAVHHELQLLVHDAGLTPYQALAMATRNVADFLEIRDSAGTVEVGKRADLVLLNGNPLWDIRNTWSPDGVMVGGRWLSRREINARLTYIGDPPHRSPDPRLVWP